MILRACRVKYEYLKINHEKDRDHSLVKLVKTCTGFELKTAQN